MCSSDLVDGREASWSARVVAHDHLPTVTVRAPAEASIVPVALGGAALVGGLDGSDATTTTVRTVAERNAAEPASPSSGGLSVREIYARAKGAVVQVDASGTRDETGFFGEQLRVPSRSQGSGFVIDRAGRIVTNYHVVQDAQEVRVSFSNDEEMSARVVGVDPATDLAVLQVDEIGRAHV